MSDIPKIAYDRLRTAAPAGPHPDADVLAAFAEQKLSATEREGVLQHIARCSDCREVVALGLPPSETVAELDGAREEANAVPVLRSRSARNWFAWPNLRWAGLAAAMVVVASVLMLRPGKERKATFATLNKQVETSAPAAASNQLAATAPRPAESPAAEKSALPVLAQSAKPDNSVPRARPELRMMEPLNGSMPAQAPPAEVGTLAGNKRSDAVGDTRLYSLEAGKQELKTPKASAGVARDEIVAREQVEVSAAQPAVSTEADAMSQAAPAQDKLMARGNAPPPIEKAKPAAKEEARKKAQLADNEAQKQLRAGYSATGGAVFAARKALSKDVAAQWSFAQGVLKRSLDGGATWQIALQLDHPLLSFGERGSDIWAGGQAGTLFHSVDSGTTWAMVQPATKTETLSADIVAIDVRSPAEIVLTTSNNESWTTADAGKTWEKK